MDIHLEATGFDVAAAEYEKGRPGYPEPALARLAQALALGPGKTVLDLAAGTGKFTRQLLPLGVRVVAVEPVAGMRSTLEQVLPQVEVLEGTAEQVPLPESSVDAVTVAQAFHWFRGSEALAELHRVLVPEGGLGLVWNVRDLAQPLQSGIEMVVSRYRGSSPTQASGQWREAFVATSLFGPLGHEDFHMEQEVTTEQLVARVMSTSFMALLPAREQERASAEVAGLVPAGHETVTLRYVTHLYWCTAL